MALAAMQKREKEENDANKIRAYNLNSNLKLREYMHKMYSKLMDNKYEYPLMLIQMQKTIFAMYEFLCLVERLYLSTNNRDEWKVAEKLLTNGRRQFWECVKIYENMGGDKIL